MIGQTSGDIAGSANDSSRNGVADGDSDAKPHSKYLQEFALFLAWMG
jgi:hypothetical protein